jgi:hypothetical protein
MAACGSCRFYDDPDRLGFGLCRIHPPQPDSMPPAPLLELPDDEPETDDELDAFADSIEAAMVQIQVGAEGEASWRGRWPSVANDDWCGSFLPGRMP